MFKMLLGSNANFLCSNLPYNTNILEISKKSQPNFAQINLLNVILNVMQTNIKNDWTVQNI